MFSIGIDQAVLFGYHVVAFRYLTDMRILEGTVKGQTARGKEQHK